jgi:hypothetical protein
MCKCSLSPDNACHSADTRVQNVLNPLLQLILLVSFIQQCCLFQRFQSVPFSESAKCSPRGCLIYSALPPGSPTMPLKCRKPFSNTSCRLQSRNRTPPGVQAQSKAVGIEFVGSGGGSCSVLCVLPDVKGGWKWCTKTWAQYWLRQSSLFHDQNNAQIN